MADRIIVSEPGATRVVAVGTRGQRGVKGDQGEKGDAGDSAYQVWLDNGNAGTEQDFLFSLIGGQFTHDQMTPATVWSITHNLGFLPNVTAFDSAGTEIIGHIDHINQNSVTITFSSSNAGKAYLS